ncbi:hydroxyacid dehydrogenase [Microbacterium pumilum]|uniref:hydroxyacid dehydrogenase n=1 Tax=Microbacterium pumilum TaxID=344165 RepID=UPI0031D8B2A1
MKRRAAVSMDEGLPTKLFDHSQRERLARHLTFFDNWDARYIEVLITGWGAANIGPDELDRMPALRVIHHSGGTVRGFLSREVWDRGILVTTSSAANALPVAEFTLATILFAGKDVLAVADDYARDPWIAREGERFASIGNYNRTVGIVGASQIGRRVIELLRQFDCTILVFDPYLNEADAAALGVTTVSLQELFRSSDIVSVHAPLLPQTVGMISAELLASMKRGATFINTARAGLVDQPALVRLLEQGRLKAVLDVTDPEPLPPDHPLRGLPNVLLTPHLAGAQGNELRRLGESVVREVEALAAGKPPLHPFGPDDLEKSA